MSGIGEELDQAIEAAKRRASERQEEDRREQDEEERSRQEATKIAQSTVLPALKDVVQVARDREHSAYVVLDDPSAPGSQAALVRFQYWPGKSTLQDGDYRYEAKFLVRADAKLSARVETHTPSAYTSGFGMLADGQDLPATAQEVRRLALEMMKKAIEEQIV